MKNKMIGFLSILLILAMIPLVSANKPTAKAKAKIVKTTVDPSLIAGITAETVGSDYCDEAIKAAIIILQTNYKCNSKQFSNAKNSKNNSKIEKYAKELSGIYIRRGKEAIPVPYFKYSAGYTQPSKKYPYIRESASPWDSFYNKTGTTGVSLNGINELCNQGLNYKSALNWYLKDIKIT